MILVNIGIQMSNNEKIILDLIINNILSEVQNVDLDSQEFSFIIEKILLNCGLESDHIPHIRNILKESILQHSNSFYIKDIISADISNFVSFLFEDKKTKIDKIAVRNKQSGAIQLVSKKTYQSNSQIYTPLSAGWAKANVVMVRNKTSGEEYPILLKNFDSNKHEKVGSATPPEDKDEKKPLEPNKFTTIPDKKDKKANEPDTKEKSKDTVRPIMVEPSLKSKTMTAFVTPKSAKAASQMAPEFPDNEADILSNLQKSVKDKRLNSKNPFDSPSFANKSYDNTNEDEIYEKLGEAGLLPDDFAMNRKYSIPSSIKNKIKIPRGYISGMEQLINTIKGNDTPISTYQLPIPITTNPNATLSLFELLLLYSITLDDEDFSKFSISIETFLNSSIESNLTPELWEAVVSERTLILKYVAKKYGSIFKIIAGAWKVEEHLIDLGIDDSDLDTEKISDIFLRVNTKDEYDALEEFVVSPNKDNTLSSIEKEKFKEYIGDSKEKLKTKFLFFTLKMFPIQGIIKNEITVVFPDVIYDYPTLNELFKTDSIENLGLKLNTKNKKVALDYNIEGKSGTILMLEIGDVVTIKLDNEFESDCIQINKKIYKTR